VNFKVQRIAADQVKEFCSILREAAMWLQSEGQEMWGIEQVSTENLLREYSVEEMFLGYLDGIPAATIVLQEVDDLFWSLVTKNESLFLHKLSVRRQFAKSGLAVDMIMWAKSEAKKRNKKYLRLDCAADRPKLCKFYEYQGFKNVREQVMGKYPTAFYELEI